MRAVGRVPRARARSPSIYIPPIVCHARRDLAVGAYYYTIPGFRGVSETKRELLPYDSPANPALLVLL